MKITVESGLMRAQCNALSGAVCQCVVQTIGISFANENAKKKMNIFLPTIL